MKYERVKNFCYSEGFEDSSLQRKFENEDGYKILLTITNQINEYANQIKCICHVIDILEKWEKEDCFELNKTTYETDWFGTTKKYNSEKEAFTLPEAKNVYKDIRLKYDTLYELFIDASKIHYKEYPDNLINKYFS